MVPNDWHRVGNRTKEEKFSLNSSRLLREHGGFESLGHLEETGPNGIGV
jgi:hypothetical protein